MRSPKTLRLMCVAVLSAVAGCAGQDDPAITTRADEPSPVRESPSEAPARADGSLAALTAEVRQLRLAVEELARSQSETQALGMYLSAQQSRMQQADEQLAVARRELYSTTAVRERIEAQLTDLLTEQPRATSADKRAEIEDAIKAMQYEQTRVDRDLQQARSRESQLSQVVQSEETRWNELIARLEKLAQ